MPIFFVPKASSDLVIAKSGFGLTLVLIHAAFGMNSWYSWLPLILVLGSLITGLIISLVKTQKRQSFLLIHSLLSPLLLTNIVYHSTQKMDHDFFPLVERAPSIAFSVTKILIINPTPA